MRVDVILQMQQLASRAFELKEAELQAARAQAHQMQDVLAACMGNLAASVSTPLPKLCVCADCQSQGLQDSGSTPALCVARFTESSGCCGLIWPQTNACLGRLASQACTSLHHYKGRCNMPRQRHCSDMRSVKLSTAARPSLWHGRAGHGD
jgi:hypothetical protein